MEKPSTDVVDFVPTDSQVVKPETEVPGESVATPEKPTPGTKTPEANLLAALQEERAKRREAEDKLNNLTATNPTDEFVSDEAKLLAKRLGDLEARNKALEDERELERVQVMFPQIKEFAPEFQDFLKDYPRNKMLNVAKLFLTEKGLLEAPRKGLEKPTGGARTPGPSGMTSEEIDNLRKNDWRKYRELLMDDKLKPVN